jgi:hypothetical protein
VTICVRFVPFTRGRERSRAPEHHEGNSGFMGSKKSHFLDKMRQLPVVWRRIEKDFTTAEIQKQRLFYQLLEMTAVSFPK